MNLDEMSKADLLAEGPYWAEVSRIRSNEKQPKSGFRKARIERRDLTPGIERLVTPNRLPIKNRSAQTAQAGFTIVEIIVVVTIIGFLAAVALGAYANVANDAKIIKYKALISTLTAAKSAWLADPVTTARDVQTFNTGPEGNFAMIAPYIRVNGAQPTDEQHLLSLSGMPNSVRIELGTVDDSSFGGQNSDQSPTVTLITPNRLPIKNRSAETAQTGFTIVEIIVVVTVIGFLAAVALGAYANVAEERAFASKL